MNKESTKCRSSNSSESPSTRTKDSTHYEILGVQENADFATIKNAHRKLALRFHPDKIVARKGISSNGSDGGVDNNENDETFKIIQTAWECLSDEKRRSEYDDALSRTRERDDGNIIKAQNVKLAEMTFEICDVADDVGDGSDHGEDEIMNYDGVGQAQKLYSYKCRCGDTFEMLEEELNFNVGSQSNNIFQCESCSLLINVIP